MEERSADSTDPKAASVAHDDDVTQLTVSVD